MSAGRRHGTVTETMRAANFAIGASALHNADFAKCIHGIRDDGDCTDCNANGCCGGGDCECGGRYSKRDPMPFGTTTVYET